VNFHPFHRFRMHIECSSTEDVLVRISPAWWCCQPPRVGVLRMGFYVAYHVIFIRTYELSVAPRCCILHGTSVITLGSRVPKLKRTCRVSLSPDGTRDTGIVSLCTQRSLPTRQALCGDVYMPASFSELLRVFP
jgi:hypothetical protein